VRIHDFVLGCFSVKLKHFSKFNDMTEALSAATASIEGKLSKGLRKFLKKVYIEDVHDQLAVADAKLGVAIKVSSDLIIYFCFFYCLCLFVCFRTSSQSAVSTALLYQS
jgi:hypothetical protein